MTEERTVSYRYLYQYLVEMRLPTGMYQSVLLSGTPPDYDDEGYLKMPYFQDAIVAQVIAECEKVNGFTITRHNGVNIELLVTIDLHKPINWERVDLESDSNESESV